VHAALVCSKVARDRVNHIDTGTALRHREVLRVLTDFAGVRLPFDTRQISYFGQPVAVVIATTLGAAAHGCRSSMCVTRIGKC
jgi:xanthine dehydrogenase YagR molybdenum-binding subunit